MLREADASSKCRRQGLLLCCGSIQSALPILAATFAAVIACWLRAVNTLGTTIKVRALASLAQAGSRGSCVVLAADGLE